MLVLVLSSPSISRTRGPGCYDSNVHLIQELLKLFGTEGALSRQEFVQRHAERVEIRPEVNGAVDTACLQDDRSGFQFG